MYEDNKKREIKRKEKERQREELMSAEKKAP